MAQKKGQTGNPNGRPKGSPNKTSAEIRNLFQTLIQNNIEHLQSDFDSLEPKERINSIIKLSEFILPKLQAVKMQNEDVGERERVYALLPDGTEIEI